MKFAFVTSRHVDKSLETLPVTPVSHCLDLGEEFFGQRRVVLPYGSDYLARSISGASRASPRSHLSRWHPAASRARREGGLRPGSRAVSQYCGSRRSRTSPIRCACKKQRHPNGQQPRVLTSPGIGPELGDIYYVLLFNAQPTYRQALLSLVQARAARCADSGGWWNRSDVEPERPLTISDVLQ